MASTSAPQDARVRGEVVRALAELRAGLVDLGPRSASTRVGEVVRVADGVATVRGLSAPVAGEAFEVEGVLALAEEVGEEEVRLVLLGASEGLRAGSVARRLGRGLEVPVGPELLGRVVDPLGVPVDGRGPVGASSLVRVDPPGVRLREREPVRRALRTGILAVDTMIPIGRGQRQLVIGDRATGKTELCLALLAALDPGVVGVYVAIGRRGADTAARLRWLREHGVLERGFAVVAEADDPVGLIHLAPISACAMAESLARAGRDVVIVYDDLTNHANAHRSLALLLGRPVGREAHPVDVFYVHARLLERATQYGPVLGGGSLTAFPIIETQAGDLTAYIPTNLVSITDGQIRLDAAMVAVGDVPAVDVGLSVSRVGSKAQPLWVRRLAGSFRHRYAQFLEVEEFARFGTQVEESVQRSLDWGRRVRVLLRQAPGVSRSWIESVARLLFIASDALVQVPLDEVAAVADALDAALRGRPSLAQLDVVGEASLEGLDRVRLFVEEFTRQAVASLGVAPGDPEG